MCIGHNACCGVRKECDTFTFACNVFLFLFVDLLCLVRVLNIKSFKSESSFPKDWLTMQCRLRCVSVMVVAQHHHVWPLCVYPIKG